MLTMISDLQSVFLHDNNDRIAERLAGEHPADIASALQEINPQRAWSILKLANRARQAAVFGYLDHEFQTSLATVTPRADLAAIMMEMSADDRADLYKELTKEQREALLPGLAQAEREDIRLLASYDEGTAGAIMTSDYAALSPELSATQALTVLRREAPDKETINRAYVIDDKRKLLISAES